MLHTNTKVQMNGGRDEKIYKNIYKFSYPSTLKISQNHNDETPCLSWSLLYSILMEVGQWDTKHKPRLHEVCSKGRTALALTLDLIKEAST